MHHEASSDDQTTVWTSPSGRTVVAVLKDDVFINRKMVHFTDTEWSLLKCIIDGAGKVRTKTMMLDALYSVNRQAEQKIIDVLICTIRAKLAVDNSEAWEMIQTVWGRGYALATTANMARSPKRWFPKKKEMLLESLDANQRTIDDVLTQYPDLSTEELLEWRKMWEAEKRPGLRATRVQLYAQHMNLT